MSDYKRWIRDMMKVAERAGWIVKTNGHIKFRSPDGQTIVCSVSPRNPTGAMLCARRLFKIAGLCPS